MNKICLEYEGVEYYDYDLYFTGNGPWKNNDDNHSYVDYDTYKKIDGIIKDLKTNSTFTPAKGDEICVIPDCKYNLEDIRRNYKIKRGYDKGTCNVFSENTFSKDNHGASYCMVIIPSKKAVIADFHKPNNLIQDALCIFPDINIGDIIKMFRVIGNTKYYYYTIYRINIGDAYVELLKGTLSKPAVHIDNLDLNTGEQLTLDTLEIVHKLCEEKVDSYSSGWDEKLKLQLSALNGLDWRKYPGTINVLLNGFLYYRDSAISEMRSITSRYPKNVKNFLKFSHEGFASKDDINLACSFARRILGLENTEFTTMKDIRDRLSEKKMMVETFFALFNNMVRFKDKEWKDE